jgi:hypothetical protein
MSEEGKPTPASDFTGRIRVYVKLKASDTQSAHEQLLAMIEKTGITLGLTSHSPDAERLKDSAWLITLHPKRVMRELNEDVSFPSFDGADAFYAWLQHRKTRASVVTDTFSRARVDLLRPLVRDVEEEFRLMFLRQGIVLDEIDKHNQRRSGDHTVSMLYTHRLLNGYFLGPADDAYYLKRLGQATTDEERLAARSLTRLDQLGYGRHANALGEFSEVRNIVAHNRILPDEQFMRNYRNLTALKDTIRTRQFMETVKISAAQMQSFAQSMRIIYEQMAGLGQAMAKAYTPMTQMTDMIAAMIPKINPIINSQMKDILGAANALSKLGPTVPPMPKFNLPLPPTLPLPPAPPAPKPKKPHSPKKPSDDSGKGKGSKDLDRPKSDSK